MNYFQRNAKVVVILACIAASTSAVFVRIAEDVPSMAVGFYRLSFTMPFLSIPALTVYRKELTTLSRKQLTGSLLAGLFLFLHFLTWFMGIVRTTVASAVILCTLHPIFVLLITAIVFRDKIKLKPVAGVIVALIGASIVAGGDFSFSGDAIVGDLLALSAAFFMAMYLVFGNKLRPGISAAAYVFLVFGSCWIFFALGMLVTDTPFTGYSYKSLSAIFAMAMICQIGAHAVFNWCLGYVSPLYIATTETGEVIFAGILAFLFFSEAPALWQYIGGGITICGIFIYNYFEAEDSKV